MIHVNWRDLCIISPSARREFTQYKEVSMKSGRLLAVVLGVSLVLGAARARYRDR